VVGVEVSTLSAWNAVSRLPGGRTAFSHALCVKVPYFGTVHPHVQELRPGYCEVRGSKRRAVHNHIGTFHAIAMCNLAEIAMGLLAEATVPETHRWIPAGMTVEYVKKASSDLRAIAELDPIPALTGKVEVEVPVRILDRDDDEVLRGVITVHVTPKS
jgi:acyl-coenzyme A thioesterase PaaI-like protein